jgi:SAM-dependent methyltransferase
MSLAAYATVAQPARPGLPSSSIRSVDPANPQERRNWELFDQILRRLELRSREQLLDAGCVSGLLCAMAAGMGVKVTGVDNTNTSIIGARRRNPRGEFHVSALESLPFADNRFDAITAVNLLQRAPQPMRVLRELKRVLHGHGQLAIATWAEPERCQSASCFADFRSNADDAMPDRRGPYAYAQEDALVGAIERGGFTPTRVELIEVAHPYSDFASAVNGLVCGGHAPYRLRGIEQPTNVAAIAAALAPYRSAQGGYELRNTFRLVLANGRGRPR